MSRVVSCPANVGLICKNDLKAHTNWADFPSDDCSSQPIPVG